MGNMERYFTIGMAGHIDHGKTTLTRALTGIDTDRLKEEKERSISIEPGFAPFIQEKDVEVAIIDVPGHERFIRQMIAGVAGIDMVILVIAADEGVMPQTKEHLHILSLLNMKHGFIVLTKMDQADQELLDIIIDDVKETTKGTFLEDAPIHFVDSVSNKGIQELKDAMKKAVLQIEKKETSHFFRLPIDQVFTVKGQGVVVRGTVYNGKVSQGDRLKLLPSNKEVRVRTIQRHHEEKTDAKRGQRTAINIGGISHEEIARGDVLVADNSFSVSDRIDIDLSVLPTVKHEIKQRQPIKLHIGTSEVMGKIIFFDRNQLNKYENEAVLCQLQLDEAVVVTRGDRFILRRPTPMETVGGGWVIEPNAKKHRFGPETIETLKQKKDGSTADRIKTIIQEKSVVTKNELIKQTSISEEEFHVEKQDLLEVGVDQYTLPETFKLVKGNILDTLATFHQKYPMRLGINKAALLAEWTEYPAPLLDYVLEKLEAEWEIKISHQYIALKHVSPTLPPKWKTKLEHALQDLINQGMEVEKWEALMDKQDVPMQIENDFYYYLLQTEQAFGFDEDRLISKKAVDEAIKTLKTGTTAEAFSLQTARDALQLTRKNLIPLLELLDQLGYTKRDGNRRIWVKQ